jgi:hypothetical protein
VFPFKPPKASQQSLNTMNTKDLSTILQEAAILLTLLTINQESRGQECPSPYFCSRTASGDAAKTGYLAYTDLLDGWDGVYHYYLRQDVVASEEIDFKNLGTTRSQTTANGSLSAHIAFVIDPMNSSPEHWANSWTISSSVSESGTEASYEGPVPFSITGSISALYEVPGDISMLGGWYWPFVDWQTTNNLIGLPPINNGVFSLTDSHRNNDLGDFAYCLFAGTQTFTFSDTVKNNDVVYNCSSGSDYANDSYTETMTLSVPYDDALFAKVINAKASSFVDNWTDPPASLAARFSVTTNEDGSVSGTGTKMQYRVAVPASEKGMDYRFKWFEVTRDSGGKVLSKANRGCAVAGTGDPVNPALSDILDVPVPSQPGATTVAEGLTPDNEVTTTSPQPWPPTSGPKPPPRRLPLVGAGGR